MSKKATSLIATAVLAASTLGSGIALAEVSANIGVTSNYIWRGVSQSDDGASVSGGLDYAHTSGLYAGTWAASIDGGTELDLYLGYAGEAGAIGYDIGYIHYLYPNDDDLDFGEIYLGASYSLFSAMLSYDPDNQDMYAQLGVDFELGQGFGLGLHVGSYRFKDEDSVAGPVNYSDYAVTLSKDDFSFAISNMSKNEEWGQSDNYRVAVSWSTSF